MACVLQYAKTKSGVYVALIKVPLGGKINNKSDGTTGCPSDLLGGFFLC
jgi:hypothetical protein